MAVSRKNKPLPQYRHQKMFLDERLMLSQRHVLTAPTHAHDHDFMELVFVVGGRGNHRSAAGLRKLTAGDVLVLRPGAWHAYENCQSLEVHNCCFAISMLRRELAWTMGDAALSYLFWEGPLREGNFGQFIFKMPAGDMRDALTHADQLAAMLKTASGSHASQVGCLLMVLGKVSPHVPGRRVQTPSASRDLHPAAISATALLEEQPRRDWSLDDLAAAVHVDRSYLVRLIKAHTGMSPMAYLARHRAELAARLLLQTDRPISRIAADVGWPDPNYFARRFKQHFGISASDYRNQAG